jgi:hypothetical protein
MRPRLFLTNARSLAGYQWRGDSHSPTQSRGGIRQAAYANYTYFSYDYLHTRRYRLFAILRKPPKLMISRLCRRTRRSLPLFVLGGDGAGNRQPGTYVDSRTRGNNEKSGSEARYSKQASDSRPPSPIISRDRGGKVHS